jgi:hypothetical protein
MLQRSFRIAAIRAGRSIFIRGMTAVRTFLPFIAQNPMTAFYHLASIKGELGS